MPPERAFAPTVYRVLAIEAAVIAALLACATLAHAADAPRLKVALTFDDLPLNGTQPAGVSMAQMTRDTLAVLKKYRVPP